MVAAVEEQRAGVGDLPGGEGQHDFDGEGASVYEVTVEEVRVGGGGHAVEFPDVEEVVVLAWG